MNVSISQLVHLKSEFIMRAFNVLDHSNTDIRLDAVQYAIGAHERIARSETYAAAAREVDALITAANKGSENL